MSGHVREPGDLPAGIEWMTDKNGAVTLGVRRVTRDGDAALELYLPDGTYGGVVTSANAASVIQKLQTGLTFAQIVGDEHFGIDLNDL